MSAQAWWRGAFLVERECTCRSKCAECPRGFHCVDSTDSLPAAMAGAAALTNENPGVAYRVVEAATDCVLRRRAISNDNEACS